jgi:hypothetical protein
MCHTLRNGFNPLYRMPKFPGYSFGSFFFSIFLLFESNKALTLKDKHQ